MMKFRLPETVRTQQSESNRSAPKTGLRGWFTGPERDQSRGEEIANSISHGIALVAALAGTPFLIIHATSHGDAGFVVGVYLFSATMIILYLSSTLYHGLRIGEAKRLFRVFEHCAIFLLIAGTYAPFSLGVLKGVWGWTLLGMVWGLALTGVVVEVFGKKTRPMLSTGLYLLMGWLAVIAIGPLFARVPAPGMLLLFAGGLSYTAGVAFFASDSRLRYGHFIWHLFVIAGTTCHYFAVLWYAG
ncbi:hemolysin III family protein [Nitrosospira sp. Nsp2]|uniref:PAQR family membrane homeostasis protein TrhA n=1 Tax=Nitrosospira sp. Nsp2 TaxID=136548 RepID=UPI0021598123|nr:hemolysin III family protein [Nitrosospira sp. Nsp2]